MTGDHLDDRALHELYDEFLDEVFGTVEIAGHTYGTSHAWKDLDPIAYRCGFNDWLDAQVSDGIFEEREDGEYYVAE